MKVALAMYLETGLSNTLSKYLSCTENNYAIHILHTGFNLSIKHSMPVHTETISQFGRRPHGL